MRLTSLIGDGVVDGTRHGSEQFPVVGGDYRLGRI